MDKTNDAFLSFQVEGKTLVENFRPHTIEGILKRYPEIGDRPKKVLSNPPEGSIETPKKVLSNPLWGPKQVP